MNIILNCYLEYSQIAGLENIACMQATSVCDLPRQNAPSKSQLSGICYYLIFVVHPVGFCVIPLKLI